MRSKRGWRAVGLGGRTKSGRFAATLAAGIVIVGACGSGSHSVVQPPATVRTTSTTATSSTTAAGQIAADASRIRALLLGTKDLPAGFTAAPDTEVGDDSSGLSPCGHLVLPVTGASARARAAFDRNGNQEQVVEQVVALDVTRAAALVAELRQAAGSCHQFDQTNAGKAVTLQVTPIHPPAVGEEVAGVQLANSARFIDLVIVRSGQVDAILVMSEVGNPVPTTTMEAVVTAAGTKLAAGLGG